ncbi:MAG: tetratricopeptide repeat protein [Lewinellaceae bacterium]|nr:tetratricopeptide repeat protein [Lewinellaceae bacterium]
MVERDLGNFAEAKRLHQKALGISEQALAADHPDLATSYNNLAIVEEDLGNLAEAKQLYQKALAIREKSLPPGHQDTLTCLRTFANLLEKMDQGDEAQQRLEDTKIARRSRENLYGSLCFSVPAYLASACLAGRFVA